MSRPEQCTVNLYENFEVHSFTGFNDRERAVWRSISQLLEISASIIQGSVIGPVSYVVSASDLSTVTPGNFMFMYADDTYIIIPASNAHSRDAELDNVAE